MSVSKTEIIQELNMNEMFPKSAERFKIKGTQDPSTTVMLTFASMDQKNRLIREGFRYYFQSFRVVEFCLFDVFFYNDYSKQ